MTRPYRPFLEACEERIVPTLTIVPQFGVTLQNDPNATAIEGTINQAIAAYASCFSDSTQVHITFDLMASGLGQSQSYYNSVPYASYRAALVSHATTTDDSTAVQSLPDTPNNPVNNTATINIKTALRRTLGIPGGDGPYDSTILLNTSICNIDRTGLQDSNKYDLLTVVCHEIDEALGTGSWLDGSNNGAPVPSEIEADDLYRYDQNGNRSYDSNLSTLAYYSLDGGTTQVARFNQTQGGDFGDWYSTGPHVPQIQDAFATPGATPNLGTELRRLDVLGYTRANNYSPVLTPAGNQSAIIGVPSSLNLGSFTDPDTAPWGISINWGDGSSNTKFFLNSAGAIPNQTHTYSAGGNYQVTVTVTDFTGLTDNKSFYVTASAGSLSASLNNGRLSITDIDALGKDNHLTVTRSGSNLVISDALEAFTSAPLGGSLSNGKRTLTIPISLVTAGVDFQTNGGDDSLTVDHSGGLIPEDISFDGGSQNTSLGDRLIVTGGTFGTVAHSLTGPDSGAIVYPGAGTVSYAGLEGTDTSGSTISDLILTLPAGNAGGALGDDGTVGNQRSELSSNTNAFVMAIFANPVNSLTVNAGSAFESGFVVYGLPDFDRTLTLGSESSPFYSVNVDGSLNLGSNQNLSADALWIGLSSNLSLQGNGSVTLRAAGTISINNASLTSTEGDVLLESNPGVPSGNFIGVDLNNATINSGSGNLTISGQGGRSGSFNYGVRVMGTTLLTSTGGAISITGISHGNGGSNYGLLVTGGAQIIAGGAGTVSISGQGSTVGQASFNFGILVQSGSISSQSGNVSVVGTGGGKTTSDSNYGIEITSGHISAGGMGTVHVHGQGGSSSPFGGNTGVILGGSTSQVTSGGGNVLVEGIGGASSNSHGVNLTVGGLITAGGLGSVTVEGQGGISNGIGVMINGSGSVVTSGGGNVLVEGTGGGSGATSPSNYGVFVINGGQIRAGNTGSVTVVGTGGGTGGNNNYGLLTSNNGQITSGGGDIFVTGQGGVGNNAGIHISSVNSIVSGNNANVTVTTDSLVIDDTGSYYAIAAGNGILTLQTRTAGAGIDLGGEDVLGGTPVLGLSTNELVHVTGSQLRIGRYDAYASGDITVSAAVANSLSVPFLTLLTGGSIAGPGSITVPYLALRAATGIFLNGDNHVSQLAAVNSTSGGISFNDADGYSVDYVDSLSGLTAPGQSIALNGGAGGPVTVNWPIMALGSGGSVSITSLRNINVVANITAGDGIDLHAHIAGGGAGNFSGIDIQNSTLNSGVGDLILEGIGGASAFEMNMGVRVTNNALITTTGGNISITGTGGGNASSGQNYGVFVYDHSQILAGGTGTVTVTGQAGLSGYGDHNRGVEVITGSVISSQGGSVSVTGTGGGSWVSNSDIGVDVLYGSTISAGGLGTVSVTGYGGNSSNGSNQFGVWVAGSGSQITSSGGSVFVTGIGGASGGAGSSSYGVYVNSEGTISAGNTGTVNVSGTGGSSSGNINYGVFVTDANSQISSNGGDVTIQGTGGGIGASDFDFGVNVAGGGTITAVGLGRVSISGQGGLNTNGRGHLGVMVEDVGSLVTSSGGDVTITGTGGGIGFGSGNFGVQIDYGGQVTAGGLGAVTIQGQGSTTSQGNQQYGVSVWGSGSLITSTAGPVSVTGVGGGSGSSAQNYGLAVENQGQISAGGSGSVIVTGTGGASTGLYNDGIFISDPQSTITSSGGNVSVTGTGGGLGSSSNNVGVEVGNGGLITAGGIGIVNVTGHGSTEVNSGYNFGVAVHNGNNGQITSSGGNVTVTGFGGGTVVYGVGIYLADGCMISAGGTGSVTAFGTGADSPGDYNIGILVQNGGLFTSNGGDVSISGTGGGNGTSANNYGVWVDQAGQITAGGLGQVSVHGQGAPNPSGPNQQGVYVRNGGFITSSGGTVSVVGQSGGSGASEFNHGVLLDTGGYISAGGSGSVAVTGQAGLNSTGDNNIGIYMANAGTLITSSGGNISLIGIGGGSQSSNFGIGIQITDHSQISAGGAGTVSLVGTGGNGFHDNYGVNITSSSQVFSYGGGAVSVQGSGGNGTSDNNIGVYVVANGVISSGGGNVSVTGTGGGIGASSDDYGVFVSAGGQISAGGPSSVLVQGQGGTADSVNNYGVYVRDAGSSISSSGGAVTVTGTGGGSGNASFGIGVVVQASGIITPGGSGNLTVLGTGGTGNGGENWGVLVQDGNSQITSSGGTVSITGIGGAAADNNGVVLLGSASISTTGADLTITTDSLSLNAPATLQAGSGTIILQTRTAGTLIDVGQDDVLTGNPLTLGTSQTELNQITAGTLIIGRNDAIASGAATISTAITLPPSITALVLRTGVSIGETGTFTGNSLGLQAATGITLTGSNDVVHLAAQNSLSGGIDFHDTTTVSIDPVGPLNGLSAPNQSVHVFADMVIVEGNGISALGPNGTISVDADRSILVFGPITTNTGGISLQANINGTAIGTGDSNYGLLIDGATVSSNTGPIVLNAQASTSTGNYNHGVVINNNALVTTSGNITITGHASGTGSGSSHNDGVYLTDGGAVSAGGAGNITITGYGATSDGGVNGGIVSSGRATISSNTGSISITGFGGTSGSGNGGIIPGNVASNGGTISMTGSVGSGSGNVAIIVDGLIQSTTGAVTLRGDSMDIRDTGNFSAAGATVTLLPQTVGLAIDVGSIGGSTNGLLELSDSELDHITAATLAIGDSSSGSMTVSSPISNGNNLVLISSGPLTVNQAITLTPAKTLSATASSISAHASITTSGGDVSLAATNGITLNAALTTGGGHLGLSADADGNGAGTLTLAPSVVTTWSQQDEITASDGAANNRFGWSVAISADGSTAIVGALEDHGGPVPYEGFAYIFVHSGNTWNQQAKLNFYNALLPQNYFGFSVALSADGNTALIGAKTDYTDSHPNQGSAYVFVRSGITWNFQARLTAADGAVGDFFGHSVSMSADGNTVLVGALQHQVGANSYQGSAYVFSRNGATWSQQAELTASDGAAGDAFGCSVALSADGNAALVGANGHVGGQGSAYMFVRGGNDWSPQAQLTAVDGAAQDFFGTSVALSADGNTALIGSNRDNGNYHTNQGSAYLFARTGIVWNQQAKLLASDGGFNDFFGSNVALSSDGTKALIGAPGNFITPNPNQGSAYLFAFSNASWTQQAKLIALDGGADDLFATSLSLSSDGRTALIGAPYHDVGTNSNQGEFYIFQGDVGSGGGSINAGSGLASISAADFDLQNSITTTGTLTLASEQPDRPITLGSEVAGSASLTAAELAGINASSLAIGSATSGPITVTADVALGNANTQLLSGGDILLSGGQVNTGTGSLLLSPGSGHSILPSTSGTDATTSALSFANGSNLALTINGLAADSQYTQLNVARAINLTGTNLVLSGSYVASPFDTFTLVSATNITGTFNNLPEGSYLQFNGHYLQLHYTATAVTLTLPPNRPPVAVAGGPYTMIYGNSLTLDASGSSDPDYGDTLSYSWDFNNDGIYDYSTSSAIVTVPWTTLAAAGYAAGSRTLRLRVTDTFNLTSTSTASATINKRALNVTATGVDKVYNRSTAATVILNDDRIAGDVLNFTYVATFANRNVGTNIAVSVTSITMSGPASGNYILQNTTTSTSANITPFMLTGNITAANKVYNGTTPATISSRTLTGVFAGDTVTYTGGTATFSDKNVGNGKLVTATGLTLGGASAANYTVNSTATTTANITPKALTVNATGINRVYDGTITATVNLTDNRVAGDVLTDSYATASFADKNVATGKPVSVSGITISGQDAGNYSLSNTTDSTTANITKRAMAITATAQDRVYDSTRNATVTIFDNRLAGDQLTIGYTSALFASKTVGVGKTVTVSGFSLSGTDAGNYSFNASTTTTATITTFALVGSITASDKVYNGNNTATIPTRTLSGVFAGDVVNYSGGTATFSDKNVGAGKTVIATGLSLTGADAANYTVNNTATTVASITPKALTVTATGQNKVYDGITTATVTLTDNRIAGDMFTTSYASANFTDKIVANGKTINVAGISLSGADADNYSANTTATATGNITKRALAITATSLSKVYDATRNATVTIFDNRVAGDLITISYTSALFADKNVAAGKTVTVSGFALSGTDAGNYSFNTSTTTTADITPFAITGNITVNNRVYDGTATAAIATRTLSGVFAGDAVTYTGGTATFADKSVGNAKLVTATGLSLSGAAAGNYTVNTTATTTANITPKALTVTATAQNKVYDGTIAATVALSDNRVAGDVLTDNYSSATFNNKNVGNAKSVTVSGITITGPDASNYTVNATSSTTANITKAVLTVTATSFNRQYSDPNPTLASTITGLMPGDTSSAYSGSPTLSTTATSTSAPGSYVITCAQGTLASTNYSFTTVNGTMTVNPEDARVSYTGTQYIATASAATSTATVVLSATIQDITALPSDPAYDANAGNITNAMVTFINRDTNTVIASNLPVSLVNMADPKTGTATFNWDVDLGSADGAQFTIGAIVTSYYTRNSSLDNTIVAVKRPTAGTVGGSGYLVNSSSSGTYAGMAGQKTNFGITVQSSPGLAGSLSVISRATDGHVYQFTTSSITSINYPSGNTAVVTGTASVTDITNPAAPVLLSTDNTLTLQMTDNGDPGTSDTLAITLRSSSNVLLFSSKWNGSASVEQLLGGGNVQVRQAQLLAVTKLPSQPVTLLTMDQLQSVVNDAKSAWKAKGLSATQQQALGQVTFQIDDLPGNELGWEETLSTDTSGKALSLITLDRDAAGTGWFIDSTPWESSEISLLEKNSQAAGHVDLLTVVAHEIGHALGLPDHPGGNDVMTESLGLGQRRLPTLHSIRPTLISSLELMALLDNHNPTQATLINTANGKHTTQIEATDAIFGKESKLPITPTLTRSKRLPAESQENVIKLASLLAEPFKHHEAIVG